jgi:hypothetical protein
VAGERRVDLGERQPQQVAPGERRELVAHPGGGDPVGALHHHLGEREPRRGQRPQPDGERRPDHRQRPGQRPDQRPQRAP